MREDDAKSGVGAQRGGGLHKAYIKALEEATEKGPSSSAMKRSPSQCSSSSSTTSDLFAEHFPKVRWGVLAVDETELTFSPP